MEKIINNVVKEMNELIKLNKEKDYKITKLEFENSKLKEQVSSVDNYKKKLEEINIPIDERIEMLRENIEILIENYADYIVSSLGSYCPRDIKCPRKNDKEINCDECKNIYANKLIEEMKKDYLV